MRFRGNWEDEQATFCILRGVYREVMAPMHDEIVKQLGGGWSVAWDATTGDTKTRNAVDQAVRESTDAIRAVIGRPTIDKAIPAQRGEGSVSRAC